MRVASPRLVVFALCFALIGPGRTGAWSPALAGAATSAANLPVLPSADPFYAYHGNLAKLAPGTVLRSRTVPPAYASSTLGVAQVLYRTNGELGQPTVMVATVIQPPRRTGPTRLVSYQIAYDGLGDQCDPSYTVGSSTMWLGIPKDPIVVQYARAGYTVVFADYEGEDLAWGAAHEAGYGTLDGIRAAEAWLKVRAASTPVGLIGYSGGAIASEYAAELAPRYAPGLDIVGIAAGGVPVDYAHTLAYINGRAADSAEIPMVLVGLERALHFGLNRYLSAYGKAVTAKDSSVCLDDIMGKQVVTYQALLKPRYRAMFAVPAFARLWNRFIMGTSGTPKAPLFLANGDSDGIGDTNLPAGDLQELAYTYCRRGVPVQLQVYRGLDHDRAAAPFAAAANAFLTRRLAGIRIANGCSAIRPGTPLRPLTMAGGTSR